MTDRTDTDTLPPPLGWFESPHGVFRANPHLRVQFPPSSLAWQIGVHDEPTVRRLLVEAHEKEARKWYETAVVPAGEKIAARDAQIAELTAVLQEIKTHGLSWDARYDAVLAKGNT